VYQSCKFDEIPPSSLWNILLHLTVGQMDGWTRSRMERNNPKT